MHLSFDFDYTLADSSDGAIACANFALRELGMQEADADKIRKTIGLSLTKTFESLGGDPDSPEAVQFKRKFLEHSDQVMLDHIRLYPGTMDVIHMLKSKGHYISIVSTKRKKHIEAAVERDGLSGSVDLIVGGSCVENNKPHPEGLVRAMDKSGISIGQTLYTGDSVSDGECAARAGVRFIALLSGTTGHAELLKWGPVSILNNIDEVPKFVSSIEC